MVDTPSPPASSPDNRAGYVQIKLDRPLPISTDDMEETITTPTTASSTDEVKTPSSAVPSNMPPQLRKPYGGEDSVGRASRPPAPLPIQTTEAFPAKRVNYGKSINIYINQSIAYWYTAKFIIRTPDNPHGDTWVELLIDSGEKYLTCFDHGSILTGVSILRITEYMVESDLTSDVLGLEQWQVGERRPRDGYVDSKKYSPKPCGDDYLDLYGSSEKVAMIEYGDGLRVCLVHPSPPFVYKWQMNVPFFIVRASGRKEHPQTIHNCLSLAYARNTKHLTDTIGGILGLGLGSYQPGFVRGGSRTRIDREERPPSFIECLKQCVPTIPPDQEKYGHGVYLNMTSLSEVFIISIIHLHTKFIMSPHWGLASRNEFVDVAVKAVDDSPIILPNEWAVMLSGVTIVHSQRDKILKGTETYIQCKDTTGNPGKLNILLDTGFTHSYLPSELLSQIVEAVSDKKVHVNPNFNLKSSRKPAYKLDTVKDTLNGCHIIFHFDGLEGNTVMVHGYLDHFLYSKTANYEGRILPNEVFEGNKQPASGGVFGIGFFETMIIVTQYVTGTSGSARLPCAPKSIGFHVLVLELEGGGRRDIQTHTLWERTFWPSKQGSANGRERGGISLADPVSYRIRAQLEEGVVDVGSSDKLG
ncbi:uncharacterized protein BXZ73DRAFT_77071 [Epithele typhae]|uniref:uncharacterized protein n=1 Tax=Epithele typhae TaxID=378194 RepID=UPI0020089C75|nr:uncharacterized protein BXZ73DRAFT_77071 [Epithele typhae]KAH9933955.1 hypothetical protein BXZ73DRAFT_77071 [Epithele typhae]